MKSLTLALAILICGPAWANRQSFPPVDQAPNDPSLVAFREDLLAKIAARDTDAVISAACPDIYISHGTESGPEAFRQNLTVPPETLDEQTVIRPKRCARLIGPHLKIPCLNPAISMIWVSSGCPINGRFPCPLR